MTHWESVSARGTPHPSDSARTGFASRVPLPAAGDSILPRPVTFRPDPSPCATAPSLGWFSRGDSRGGGRGLRGAAAEGLLRAAPAGRDPARAERRAGGAGSPVGCGSPRRDKPSPWWCLVNGGEFAPRPRVFIARPLRAIADLVYLRDIDWKCDGPAWLIQSMRMEPERPEALSPPSSSSPPQAARVRASAAIIAAGAMTRFMEVRFTCVDLPFEGIADMSRGDAREAR